jgi:hypothetical protein
MNSTEFFALLFLGFLAAIVFGIFVGIAISEQRKDRERTLKVNSNLEAVRQSAFARLDRAGSSRRSESVLDAEVIE